MTLATKRLIICPKNLEPMWQHYRSEYGLRGQVLPISAKPPARNWPDLEANFAPIGLY